MPQRAPAQNTVAATFERLAAFHADAHCELEHDGPFQLLVATVLSAQTTDVLVNQITPGLFARYPDAQALAAADPGEVERLIQRIGMFRQKTRNIVGLSRALVAEHGGGVPRTLAELVELPGVGRKTANVVLGVAFGAPEGVVVDTHVQRLAQRLGWTKHTEPVDIEQDLMRLFPQSEWDHLAHVLIFHGRRVCFARKPSCATCVVNDRCPSAFHADQIGRKPSRQRPARASAEVIAPKSRGNKPPTGRTATAAVKAPTVKAAAVKAATARKAARTKPVKRAKPAS